MELRGKEYWRSLDELASTPEFREFLEKEFPGGVEEVTDPISRRNFLTLMGASLAMAGLAGCRRPVEKIIPYVISPEDIVLGVPQYYASTMTIGLNSYGVVVESHEGRPTIIEGNKLHPSSRGGTNSLVQASILGLYDPDRSKLVRYENTESDWDSFVTYWRSHSEKYAANKGQGLAVISESFASPTLYRLKSEFLKNYPKAIWTTYEPISDENIFEGLRIATGKPHRTVFNFDKAKVILSLDSDFLNMASDSIINSLGFANGRRVKSKHDSMNRLYAVESFYSLTGAMADHRLRIPSSHILQFAIALAKKLISYGSSLNLPDSVFEGPGYDFDSKWLDALARDLYNNKGNCLITGGYRQPAYLHSLVFALNETLGNNGKTINYHEPMDTALPNSKELIGLVKSINSGEISTLVIIGGNPVYNVPADLEFDKALQKVEQVIQLSPYDDETSRLSKWHIPESHYLESWGDSRAADGTISSIQPLIAPLFGAKSQVEMLSLLASGKDQNGHDIVRETYLKILPSDDFENRRMNFLHDGVLSNSSLSPAMPQCDYQAILEMGGALPLPHVENTNIEIVFASSPCIYDGRFANNGWLQELPDPITKLTWDNAAIMSMQTAKALNVKNQDVVRLELDGRTLEMPVWILPGQADYSITVQLGYGREFDGKISNSVGFNAYKLRTTRAMDFGSRLRISSAGKTYVLANVQDHSTMEGRPIVREATLEHYREHPDFAPEMVEVLSLQSLWKEHEYNQGYQWGMTIDLNVCTGCNACTIACQSENNIQIVGKQQVKKGREMHWIRLDRYFVGDDINDPQMVHQPMACQHCENAPCEQVCPVAATVHDKEGLNVMVYNRCVGTRYCSNNCPYKVRRFNFFNNIKSMPETVKMAQNPDVTVRSRGVMEKCTYCIQRIRETNNKAKMEGRLIADGEIVTACQQACPTQAINFGNILDKNSQVSQMKSQNRDYQVLAEFNTRPRTSYLAKIRNPNPELISHES